MSQPSDVPRLIAEVRKRPTLWNVRLPEYRDRSRTSMLWLEIAHIFNADVEQCKRKWKNLRDAYRAEVRRTKRRSLKSDLNEPNRGISKWVYFEPLSFINESQRYRYAGSTDSDIEPQHSPNILLDKANIMPNDSINRSQPDLNDQFPIKMEPTVIDVEDENIMLEELEIMVTPETECMPDRNDGDPNSERLAQTNDQLHFPTKLDQQAEAKEFTVIEPTQLDIQSPINAVHLGDADYNFLISFLPHMKKMADLQNLQFRAGMSGLLLNIMTAVAPGAPRSRTSEVAPTHMWNT